VKLDDLDERFVPRMAARLRDLLDGAADRRASTRQKVSGVTGSLLEPDPRSPLRRLDDRYASSGPLALLRDVPQLGLLLVSAVFLAGAGVALARSGDQQRAETAQQQIDSTTPTALGPEVGARIDTYVATARKRAVLASQSTPDGEYTALVSFAKYLTPQQARLTLGELDVTKVLLHAKLPSADVLPVAVDDLVPDAQKVFADVVKRKGQDAAEFSKLAGSIVAQSKEEEQFKAFYLAAPTPNPPAAPPYKGNCACIIAALVRGKARELAALASVPGVRAVELGGRGDDDDDDETLLLRPLAPEQTGIVKKIVTPTGGNGA
jgi:hypothetical protein